MDGGQRVWAPHPTEGYQVGLIVDVGADTLTVEPLDKHSKVVEASYDCVFPAVDEGAPDVEDNCSLIYLNEATLLHNLRIRFGKRLIYTYVANILLAVNPYKEISGLYSSQTIRKYNGKSIGVLPPHVFAIADKAYREMKSFKQSQSIIVSGESGAGKTESTKFVLRYLTESYGTSAGKIEQRIVEANPLLESFGNAKTMRNNNSSRFGKFVEIHFNDKYEVVGGHVSHYLLEKSRVCSQSAEERCYHVFYRLLAGAPQDMKQALGLTGQTFKYLNPASLKDPSIHDAEDYRILEQSMDKIGLSQAEKADLFRVTAAVLHLGNIAFEENQKDKKGGSLVSSGGKPSLVGVANLLGLEVADLERSLISRVMTTTKGGAVGTIINVPLKPDQASNARDALAKALYLRLFNHIVQRVNECFPFQSSSYYIGVLDIAGFEYFQVNSFEQFCINYCNEKLQQYFNARILREEQELYKRECLGLTEVRYTDNQDCIDLVEMRTTGIIDLLDEECRLPKGSPGHFTETIHQTHQKHFRLSVPRKSKLTYHRNLRDNEGFIIRHFAGAVCYMTSEFLDKNNDSLHASLEQLIAASKDPFINKLFPEVANKSSVNTKRLALDSVSSKFRAQLNSLMEKLGKTGASFIRCLKPNLKMEADKFIGGQILSQLQYAGMVEVLKLMQGGFPCRAQFSDLYQMYKAVLPAKLARLDPRLFCEALFRAVGMRQEDFKFGMSKVFFRAGKFAEFDEIMRGDSEHLAALVQKVQRWLVCKRWRKVIYGAISVQKLCRKIAYRSEHALIVQRAVRMHLAMKKHRPRYKGIARLRTLNSRTKALSEIVATLKKDKDSLVKRVGSLENSVNQQINKLKSTLVSETEINRVYNELLSSAEDFLKELESRKEEQRIEEEEAEMMRKIKAEQERERKRREEEAARLRKLQEEMERERKRREEEERKRQQEEEERKLRAELEARRLKEEEERRKAEEEARKKAEQEEADRRLAEKLEKENEERYSQMLLAQEQERRDYELALRLAQDERSPQQAIAESAVPSSVESRIHHSSVQRATPALSQQQEATRKKYNLSKWKYAELRDTINTSVDIDLLEACRDEFHRRLRVYHAWKDKNKRRTATGEGAATEQRAPQEILAQASRASSPPPPIPPRSSSLTPPPEEIPQTQRFFRVPFVHPSADKLDRRKGWWYAHFDGQWVVRQLELHPGKQPLLLLAGRNDMDMCELSLDETGLTRKRGAEILASEFEDAWKKYGGQEYVPAARKGKK